MIQAPQGTVTFMFTDIQGSTKLWETFPNAMKAVIARHDELMLQVLDTHNGYLVKSMGDGLLAAFVSAVDGVSAALAIHQTLRSADWGDVGQIQVRIGLHTGDAHYRDGDYFGPTLNRAARLMGIGHGGQVLLSHATQELLADALSQDVSLTSLGHHRLKDLTDTEHVYQLLHPELERDFPTLKSLSYLANNLPAQTTSFIGREEDIDTASSLLETSRLVTLTGIGGTGKTRLSLQVAADLIEQYADGVWFVELASVTESRVAATIAEVLAVPEVADHSVLDCLKVTLQSKQMLLVLDNCEHVLEACTKVVSLLLKACSQLSFLASSREGFGIVEETVWAVCPLPLPGDGENISSLSQTPSINLFVDRAQAVSPRFELTEDNAEAVAFICRRLDGIPLALELAAARVKVLPPQKLVERLEDRFRYLTVGKRSEMSHHQTLRATVDWSYDLLDDAEKILLNRLSVFQGRFILEAAEAICAGEGLDEFEVLDALSQLVQKSLVEVDDLGDEAFYRLLETVRQYAQEKLDESESVHPLKAAHIKFFLDYSQKIEPNLQGPDQAKWFKKLHLLHDNFRAALDWALAQKESEVAHRMCLALAWFWLVQGHLVEGREWTLKALQQRDSVPKDVQADVLIWAGNFSVDLGHNVEGQQLLEQSLAISQEIDDQDGIGNALVNLGVALHNQGEVDRARDAYQKALDIQRKLGDRKGLSSVLNNFGNVVLDQGDLEQAQRMFEESALLCEGYDDLQGLAIALSNLAIVTLAQNDLKMARSHLERSLKLSEEIGDKFGIAGGLSVGAVLCQEEGNPSTAAQLQGMCSRLLDELNMPLEPSEKASFDVTQENLQSALGEAAYQKLFETGRRFTQAQALTLAFESPQP
jgi:predicted ATPase/class 3 adenylate cyclase